MKALARLLSIMAVFCLSGYLISVQAQYAQTSDEVSIFPVTNITDTAVTAVRGVSDDGKRVLFESAANITGNNADLNPEVYIYDIDKRTAIQITNTKNIVDPTDSAKILLRVSNHNAALSGDGTKIVFSSNSSELAGANADGNQEIFLATLPLNSTAAFFQRITTTQGSTTATNQIQVFDNIYPTINSNGSLIGFVSNRNAATGLTGVVNPDVIAQIILYNTTTGAFTQVTTKNEAEGIDSTFAFKGFNLNPQLSGDGSTLIFTSGMNHAPTSTINNADLNGEVFIYNVATKVITQLTNTSGFAGYPATVNQTGTALVPDQPVNFFNQNTKHISNDGNLIVIESAGDLESGKNTDKTREVFIYNRTTAKFTQITANANLPAVPVAADLPKIDYNFTPGISPNGKFVFISSILNIVPVATGVTSTVLNDNADASREVFRYEVATAKIRQITYTPVSPRVLDQREALLMVNSNAAGTEIFFTDDVNLTGNNGDTSFEVVRAVIRPVTESNAVVAAMVNGASFISPDSTTPASNPIASGSIASIFGTRLANSSTATTRSDLDYQLNGVSVTISGIATKLFYVSPGQVNFLVPEGFGAGDNVDFVVNNNGVLSAGKFKLLNSSPGIFTVTSDGKGAGSVGCQIVTKDVAGVVLGTSYPNPPCQVSTTLIDSYLLIYGTGFRFADTASVVVTVIAADATTTDYTVIYAGTQQFFPGLDQINLLLPADFPKGTLNIKVKAATSGTAVESNVFTVVIN